VQSTLIAIHVGVAKKGRNDVSYGILFAKEPLCRRSVAKMSHANSSRPTWPLEKGDLRRP
jgi:hypothetical protein